MGPADLIISWNCYAGGIRGEESGAGIEASMSRPIRTPQSAPLRAFPQISHPAESANGRSVCQARDFLRSVARKSTKPERSLDERKEWIESTEDKLLTINEEILWIQDNARPVCKGQSETASTPPSLKASIHSGANDGVMYLG